MNNLRKLAAVAVATTFLLPAQENKGPVPAADAAAKKQALAEGTRIGVVDLVKAIEQYPKWIKLQADLDAMQKSFADQLDGKRNELAQIKAQMDVLGPDDRKAADMQYEVKLNESRALQKFMFDQLELQHMRAMHVVYEDLEVAIDKVARSRGVAIVLRITNMGPALGNPAKLPDKTLAERMRAFDRRDVLWASSEVDITDDLIKLLRVPLDEPKDAANNGKGTDGKGSDAKGSDVKGSDVKGKGDGQKAPDQKASDKPATPKGG